jgi:superfamily II DNA or RNA helicase
MRYNFLVDMKPMQLRTHQSEAVEQMSQNDLGIIIAPTGAGKSYMQVKYVMDLLQVSSGKTIVVVAPRILLACQLCEDFLNFIDTSNTHVMHVHSGETDHFSSTKPNKIHLFTNTARTAGENVIIFTTYHSLHRIQESDIEINCILFDEAHNSIKKNFYRAVEPIVEVSEKAFFFTATPKYSNVSSKPGMNWTKTFGKIIYNVSAPDLIKNGSILPPKVNVVKIDSVRDKNDNPAERDCMTLLDSIINEDHMEKVLVCAPNTKVLIRMIAETDFMKEVQSYGYDVFWITSKYGAFLNDKKIRREDFYHMISEYGKDDSKKFIVLHYSILSEGISVPGLTSCIMMRQMNMIEMTQSIGRVLRLHLDDIKAIQSGQIIAGDVESYKKSFGLVHLPVYNNVGIATVRRLESIVDTIFKEGQPVISTINK